MGGAGPTDEQWNRLLDIISDNYEMRTGHFTAPEGKTRVAVAWDDASRELNAFPGAQKTGAAWKGAYNNLKARARQAYADKTSYMHGTGGGEAPDVMGLGLKAVYARCLAIIGTVTAVGNRSVATSLQIQSQRARTQSAPSSVAMRYCGYSEGSNTAVSTYVPPVPRAGVVPASGQSRGYSAVNHAMPPAAYGSHYVEGGDRSGWHPVNQGNLHYHHSSVPRSPTLLCDDNYGRGNWQKTPPQDKDGRRFQLHHTPPHAIGISPARKKLSFPTQGMGDLNLDEPIGDKNNLNESLQIMQVTLSDTMESLQKTFSAMQELSNTFVSNGNKLCASMDNMTEALKSLQVSVDKQTSSNSPDVEHCVQLLNPGDASTSNVQRFLLHPDGTLTAADM